MPTFADTITFSATKVRSVFASGKEETVLSGSARVVTGKIEIQAEELRLSGKNQRYVESKGKVSIRDNERELTIQGDSLFYDRDEDVLRIRGNAIMEDFKNEMVIRAGVIENRNKENLAIVQVGVRIFKKDISARSETMVYRRDKKIVELNGLPVVYKNRDEYRASAISIDLETDEIQLIGKVQGNVQTKSSPAPSPVVSPSPSPGPEGTGSGPAGSPATDSGPTPSGEPSPNSTGSGPGPTQAPGAGPPPGQSQGPAQSLYKR